MRDRVECVERQPLAMEEKSGERAVTHAPVYFQTAGVGSAEGDLNRRPDEPAGREGGHAAPTAFAAGDATQAALHALAEGRPRLDFGSSQGPGNPARHQRLEHFLEAAVAVRVIAAAGFEQFLKRLIL